MILEELVGTLAFDKGVYECDAILGATRAPLLTLTFEQNDEEQGRNLPKIDISPVLKEPLRSRVANALVRAGARHPGLRDVDLAALHAACRQHKHIELFVDINTLTQGLVRQIAQSLRAHIARVVVSSSTIDVLHEYQSSARRHHDGKASVLEAWELARGLRTLAELGPPVHVHQLAPGAARYFRRGRGDAISELKDAPSSEHREETTYIAEDRQMVAAFWDYLASDVPRIPLFLVTSDLALAHVCAAERVPFVFAKAPREAELDSVATHAIWFDPYALELRFVLAQTLLWELAIVFGSVVVRRVGEGPDDTQSAFTLKYDPRNHAPGTGERVTREPVTVEKGGQEAGSPRAARSATGSDRALKLSLASIIPVIPTHASQRRPLSAFTPKDPDYLRQLWQIGDATGLFRADATDVVAGPAFEEFLKALEEADYIAVNRIFRKVAGYDRTIEEAEDLGLFASGRKAGAAIGWAVTLGAAYKLPGEVRFGLADVSDETFERTVARVHADLANGERSVAMHRVLDRVCSELKISPVRFEACLQRCLGQRGLRDFEAQRAKSNGKLPAHDVIVAPTSSASSSYLRHLAPGEGVVVASKLVGTLVRRSGGV